MKALVCLRICADLPESSVQDNAKVSKSQVMAQASTTYLGSLIIVELQIAGLDLRQHQVPGNTQ